MVVARPLKLLAIGSRRPSNLLRRRGQACEASARRGGQARCTSSDWQILSAPSEALGPAAPPVSIGSCDACPIARACGPLSRSVRPGSMSLPSLQCPPWCRMGPDPCPCKIAADRNGPIWDARADACAIADWVSRKMQLQRDNKDSAVPLHFAPPEYCGTDHVPRRRRSRLPRRLLEKSRRRLQRF